MDFVMRTSMFITVLILNGLNLSNGIMYCDCFEPTDGLPFNYSCVSKCYLNHPSSSNFCCNRDKGCKNPVEPQTCNTDAFHRCEEFVEKYWKVRSVNDDILPQKKIIEVYKIPTPSRRMPLDGYSYGPRDWERRNKKRVATSAISIKSEIHSRFSYEGRSSYHCDISASIFGEERKGFLKKCFHYKE